MSRALILIAAASIGACAAAGPAGAAPPRDFYGVTPQTELNRKDYNEMRRGRVGTLRFELSWGDIDPPPTSDEQLGIVPRHYRWRPIDRVVRRAARRGIRVLPTVYGTPNWVARYQGCSRSCHKVGPASLQAYGAFSEFMGAAADRYGTRGKFWAENPHLRYLPVRTWQIWNEQNSSDFWKPAPNPEHYAYLVIAGGEAVHEADRRANVILGGMLGDPTQSGKKTVSGWSFLAALYKRDRVRAAFDGIAVHPYGAQLRSVKRTMWRWRQEMRAARARRDRIWVTEIGWASGGSDHPLNKGPKGQARMIGQALDYFTTKRQELNIAGVNIFAWRDSAPGVDPCDWCAKSGLFHYRSRKPKPSWDVFKSFTGGR